MRVTAWGLLFLACIPAMILALLSIFSHRVRAAPPRPLNRSLSAPPLLLYLEAPNGPETTVAALCLGCGLAWLIRFAISFPALKATTCFAAT